MGYTGDGPKRNVWTGRLAVTELNPKKPNDLTTKNYVDDRVNIIVVLDGAVATLDGNVLILQ